MVKPSESALGPTSGTGLPFRSAQGASLFELTPADTCRCERSHVALSGEVDLAGVDRLTAALEWFRLAGHRDLVIDVSELRFLSATGLGVLTFAAHDYAAAGGRLTLARPTSMIDRVLVAANLGDLLVSAPEAACDCWEPVAESPQKIDLAVAAPAVLDRISAVLAGLSFPAMRWQLLTQADYYGADHRSRSELAGLPEDRYADIEAVHRALRARSGCRDSGGRPMTAT